MLFEIFVSDYGKDISRIPLQIFSLMFHVSHIDFAKDFIKFEEEI